MNVQRRYASLPVFLSTLVLALLTTSATGQAASDTDTATAIFAGGCFWCMEPPYDKLEGVIATTSGYTGGSVTNPTYEQVSAGNTGHYEAVRVQYDPDQVTYQELVEVFWRNIDPLDGGGQFCDRGSQYLSAVFFQNDEQRAMAQKSLEQLQAGPLAGRNIATKILPAMQFYPAEAYHQDYYMKNPLRYRFYRFTCGRDGRLEELWGEQ